MITRLRNLLVPALLVIAGLILVGCVAELSTETENGIQDSCVQTPFSSDCPEGGLMSWLAMPAAQRPVLHQQVFAQQAVAKSDAMRFSTLLLDDYQQQLQQQYGAQWQNRLLQLRGLSMPFYFQRFGNTAFGQRSLFISMHGGGGTTAAVNDSQYVNQQHLYDTTMRQMQGIYLAPRAPTDASDMWYKDHIDEFFSLIVQLAMIFEGVDPNRVYLMGYSAGGDGVYQLAPRMADRWAAAAMMAGHPNASSPYSLANTPFTIHVGSQDNGYDRNLRAEEWNRLLGNLQQEYPGYYDHFVQLHEGYGHWMELQDSVALPWMAKFTRDAIPARVHWQQTTQSRSQLYWLSMPVEQVVEKRPITVALDVTRNSINIIENYAQQISIWLNDDMLDLDGPIVITFQGRQIFNGQVTRKLSTMHESIRNRGDHNLIFSVQLKVENNSMVYQD